MIGTPPRLNGKWDFRVDVLGRLLLGELWISGSIFIRRMFDAVVVWQ